MTTAMQTAKLRACTALTDAREAMLSARSFVCWADGDRRVLFIVGQIDAMLQEVLPSNEGPPSTAKDPLNQCDGCRRGLAIGYGGYHVDYGQRPVMACTRESYAHAHPR